MKKEERYDPRKIESYWQKKWEEARIYRAIDFDKRPKKYILFEFPYPSGERLHIGHAFTFTGTDVLARFNRMRGFNVLTPIGWDAFGLPAENYAIKTGINPMITTAKNIANSKIQAKRLALSVDWDREISTADPKYYKWTQWIFLQWYKRGLAYKAEMPINWCPACKIGLANEEVVGNKCERCGAEVERRNIKQWIVKITDYAEKLIEGLEKTAFIEKVKAAQINWIGRSEGAEINFQVVCRSESAGGETKNPHGILRSAQDDITTLKVFTTRPDTLFGATFLVFSPEHEIVEKILSGEIRDVGDVRAVREYVEKARKKSDLERTELDKEKTGVFSGLTAINPATKDQIPIWISDFVLSSYGTGAIMAVPAHDQRDFEFAKKYGLPVVPVIVPADKKNQKDEGNKLGWDFNEKAYVEVENGITINSPEWNGIKPSEAIRKAIEWLEAKKIGKRAISYHLRDWIFSRQHYWGEPIPMIFCEKCASEGQGGPEEQEEQGMAGCWPVPEEELPVELPKVEKYQPTETGESPLAEIKDWVNVKCPKCGGPAKRETDTMPNWAGSDWYYLAYPLADKLGCQMSNVKCQNSQGKNIFKDNLDLLKYWLPVDVYVGGDEHNTLHLLYSRFTYQFLWDMGVVPEEYPEPYYKRLSHGVILGPDGQRMSKSKGNIINPDEVVEAFGADSLRLYLMFMGPFESTMIWSQESMEGCYRFIKRVWTLVGKKSKKDQKEQKDKDLERKVNQTVKKVGEDIDKMKFNTAVAAMMELVNEMDKEDKRDQVDKGTIERFLLILAPFAPHITEELWERLGNKFSIHQQKWPEYNPDLIEEDFVTIAVQVNGKLRDTIQVQNAKCKMQSEVEEIAKNSEKIKKYLEGKEIKNTIFVPGKLINFVI